MKSLFNLVIAVVLFFSFTPAVLFQALTETPPAECGPNRLYLPLVIKANAMTTNHQYLEEIMRRDAAFPYDGFITQIFINTVNVRQVGTRTILRDVALPSHIKADQLKVNQPVRLGEASGKTTVIAIFEQMADPESVNYAGVGSQVPGTTIVSVQATRNGWQVTWPHVSGARCYKLYRNDDANGDSPEEIATIWATGGDLSYLAPPEITFRYFAVKAINGLLEGELSNWSTDLTPPAPPTWTSHSFQANGHNLAWSHPAASDVYEFVLYRNTSASSTGAVEVVRTNNLFGLAPYTPEGDWFGVQALDWMGNLSATTWTSQAYDPTPAIPTPVANMVEGGGFSLSWPAVIGPPPAIVYQVQSASDTAHPDTYTTEWTGQTLTSPIIARTGVTWFRVRAQGYDLSWSNWSSWVTDTNPPPQPLITVANGISSVAVSLAVSDPSHTSLGFSHYVIERADNPAGQAPTVIDSHATLPTFPRVISQAIGATMWYRLTPYDWAGNAGPASTWVQGTAYAGEGGIQDRFDGYGGSILTPLGSLWWLQLAQVESSESWTRENTTKSTWVTALAEGNEALRMQGSTPGLPHSVHLSKAMNLNQEGRFTNDDYLVIQTRLDKVILAPEFKSWWFISRTQAIIPAAQATNVKFWSVGWLTLSLSSALSSPLTGPVLTGLPSPG